MNVLPCQPRLADGGCGTTGVRSSQVHILARTGRRWSVLPCKHQVRASSRRRRRQRRPPRDQRWLAGPRLSPRAGAAHRRWKAYLPRSWQGRRWWLLVHDQAPVFQPVRHPGAPGTPKATSPDSEASGQAARHSACSPEACRSWIIRPVR